VGRQADRGTDQPAGQQLALGGQPPDAQGEGHEQDEAGPADRRVTRFQEPVEVTAERRRQHVHIPRQRSRLFPGQQVGQYAAPGRRHAGEENHSDAPKPGVPGFLGANEAEDRQAKRVHEQGVISYPGEVPMRHDGEQGGR
jgi:hypothetical protein